MFCEFSAKTQPIRQIRIEQFSLFGESRSWQDKVGFLRFDASDKKLLLTKQKNYKRA
tara:strand:- start:1518 stop:1688 length:171 start_codon:yes stop_codon:yes gene_type:complete